MLPPVRLAADRLKLVELAAAADGLTVLAWRRRAYEERLLRQAARNPKLRAALLASVETKGV